MFRFASPASMKLLDEALEVYRPYFVAHFKSGKPITEARSPRPDGVRNMRYDIEMSPDVTDPEEFANTCLSLMKKDLADLVENGDWGNLTDAFLGQMDGARKLGKEPKEVLIPSVHIFTYANKFGAKEYVVYMLFGVKWEDEVSED